MAFYGSRNNCHEGRAAVDTPPGDEFIQYIHALSPQLALPVDKIREAARKLDCRGNIFKTGLEVKEVRIDEVVFFPHVGATMRNHLLLCG